MKATKLGNVITVKFEVNTNWEQWILLRSDVHHDSVSCRRDLELKHLKKAVERNAIILDGGDLFDAMQGRFDPRRSPAGIRPEYLEERNGVIAYYDNITADLYEFYKPFSKYFLMFARGNHETSVIKNADVDITGNLVHRLNAEAGGAAFVGGYGGWVRFIFEGRTSLALKYFHGAGGDAPVTRGMIHTNRQAVYLPNADIVWNGHNHNEYISSIKKERLNSKGNIEFDLCTFIRTPGYKDDYADGSGGWEVERGGVPKPHGCAWIRLGWDVSAHKPTREVYAEVE